MMENQQSADGKNPEMKNEGSAAPESASIDAKAEQKDGADEGASESLEGKRSKKGKAKADPSATSDG